MSLLNTIAIATHKGGVGKTTSAVNLSHALALEGLKILLVDLDPQAHASRSLGIDRAYEEPCIADALRRRDRAGLAALTVYGVRENLDLLPSSIRLASHGEFIVNVVRRENLLKEALHEVRSRYDFIIIDTAPGLGVLMANAIEAADRIIIPVDTGARAIDGLTDFLNLVEDLRGRSFRRWRILRTMVSSRASKTERELVERLKCFNSRVLSTQIRRSEVANQSHYAEVTLFEYSKKSAVAEDYHRLSQEIRKYAG